MIKQIGLIGLIILIINGCNEAPHSRIAVVNLDNDKLSNLDKIRLFEGGTDKLSGPALAAIANLYANEEDYGSALSVVHKAIEIEPMNSFYHTLKSNYAYETGDVSTAYREALTAYQLGAKSLQQSLILAQMGVALSEYSIVDDIIDSLVIVYPDNPEVIYMAARKYEKSKELAKAMELYKKGISLDSTRTDNYYFLASLYLGNGEPDKALAAINYLNNETSEGRTTLLKAEAFEVLEEYDSASTYYELYVSNRTDSLVYTKLFNLYALSGRRDKLTDLLVAVADTFPNSKYFLRTAGENLDSRYRYDEALDLYIQLYELDTLDTLVAQEVSILQRKVAYLQRKRQEETRLENEISIRKLTLPSLDSIN